MTHPLTLYNSLSGKKELFSPLNPQRVTMYVCGPTVYDRAHIGNARAVVVYDILFRLLQTLYGKEHVVYARNITDVDDKINAAAAERGIAIDTLTQEVTAWFHSDMAALNALPPTLEPRATEHIEEILSIINLIYSRGHAYVSQGHVLFSIDKINDNYHYGMLSGKKLDDLIAGARVEVESYKRHPGDFVLWKPSAPEEPGWQSPWGRGRPGWHIECSAMSTTHLGKDFDIHGDGADLKFPHHENEIVQSCHAYPGSHYARYWVHNGFVTVNGEKMSKSLGNFTTVQRLLERGIKGEVIRYALLATHYRKPLDFTEKLLDDCKKVLDGFYAMLEQCYIKTSLRGGVADAAIHHKAWQKEGGGLLHFVRNDASREAENTTINAIQVPPQAEEGITLAAHFMQALCDDMNLPEAFALLHTYPDKSEVVHALHYLGFLQETPDQWFGRTAGEDITMIEQQIAARNQAKKEKNWAEADRIRAELLAQGITLEDSPTGTQWKRV